MWHGELVNSSSVIERYIVKEAIEFCSEYISKANFVGVLVNCWHSRRTMQKSSRGVHMENKYRKEVMQAHFYILNNIEEAIPYLTRHKDTVKVKTQDNEKHGC